MVREDKVLKDTALGPYLVGVQGDETQSKESEDIRVVILEGNQGYCVLEARYGKSIKQERVISSLKCC